MDTDVLEDTLPLNSGHFPLYTEDVRIHSPNFFTHYTTIYIDVMETSVLVISSCNYLATMAVSQDRPV